MAELQYDKHATKCTVMNKRLLYLIHMHKIYKTCYRIQCTCTMQYTMYLCSGMHDGIVGYNGVEWSYLRHRGDWLDEY